MGGRGERLGRAPWASLAWSASSQNSVRGWLCGRHQLADTQPEPRQLLACTEAESFVLRVSRHLQMILRDSLTILAGCSFSWPLQVLEPFSGHPAQELLVNSTAAVCNLHSSFLPFYYIYSIETRYKENIFSLWGKWSSGAGCPERLVTLHPWKVSRPVWMRLWAAWSDLTAESAFWAGRLHQMILQVPFNYVMIFALDDSSSPSQLSYDIMKKKFYS